MLEARGDEPLTMLLETYDPLVPTYPGYDLMFCTCLVALFSIPF